MPPPLITADEQLASERQTIEECCANIDTAKSLIKGSDEREAERGRGMLTMNHAAVVQAAYCSGQIKWRRALGDPTDDLELCVRQFARMVSDCRALQVDADWYWADLVSQLSQTRLQ